MKIAFFLTPKAEVACDQNFVPVVDGRQAFIGIVRRRSVLVFFRERMAEVVRGA